MTLEGVDYWPFQVSYTTAAGRERRIMRWAPYAGALADSLRRELSDLEGSAQAVKPGTVVRVKGGRQ